KPEEHALLLTLHHLVYDGWSQAILLREMAAIYEAGWHGRPSPLPELRLQYSDFALWQRRWQESGASGQDLAWWRERLAGLAPLDLPAARPRPVTASYRGLRHRFSFPDRLSTELRRLGRREGVTPFMTLAALLLTLLHRYAGEDDVPLGCAAAGRN